MEFNQDQVQALVGGGDNSLHWHSFDRTPTNDTIKGLTASARISDVTSDTTLTGVEDLISVDTSDGNVTITLPRASGKFELEILKISVPNLLIISPTTGDTILGQNLSVSVSSQGSALHFRSFGTDWRLL